MARHVVAAVADFPPGTRRLLSVDGRAIAVFNVRGEYFALLNRCPHNGGSLIEGVLTGLVGSPTPGSYTYARPGEVIRCPWHGWEFDLRTGKSFCPGIKARARPYPVRLEAAEAPYTAETLPVSIEDSYVIVEA